MYLRFLALCALLLSFSPRVLAAQERVCDFTSQGRAEQIDVNGIPIIYLYDPFEVQCSDGAVLRANSGTLNRGLRELNLVGNVYFQDATQTLTSDQATYSSALGRLYATGNVVFTNRAEGSTIRGPELEYWRPIEGRPEAQVNASQRPHLTLRPREQGPDAEPLELDADRVNIFGQDQLSAFGNVVIDRPDMHATSAEARYNAATEELELRGDARIRTEEYSLRGAVIQARLAEGALQDVVSRTDALLEGKEMTVTAPELHMFFQEELLQRAVASRGASGDSTARAVAVARNFHLEADSIDALLPGQQLDQLIAVGRARGETLDTAQVDSAAVAAPADSLAAAPADTTGAAGDSLAVLAEGLTDRDWILGDTLTGFFARADSAARPAADTVPADTGVVLKRIVARGAAQTLYRVQPQDTAARSSGKRGISYIAGRVIELTFENGQVDVAEVTGMRHGIYLDPQPAPAPATPGTPGAPQGGTPPGQVANGGPPATPTEPQP